MSSVNHFSLLDYNILPPQFTVPLDKNKNIQINKDSLSQNPYDLYSYICSNLKTLAENNPLSDVPALPPQLIQKLQNAISEGKICLEKIIKISLLAQRLLPGSEIVRIQSEMGSSIIENVSPFLLARLPWIQNKKKEFTFPMDNAVFNALISKDYYRASSFSEEQLFQFIHGLCLENNFEIFVKKSFRLLTEDNFSTFLHIAFQLKSCRMLETCLEYVKTKAKIKFKVSHTGTCKIYFKQPASLLLKYLVYFPKDKTKFILNYAFSPIPEKRAAILEFGEVFGEHLTRLNLSKLYSYNHIPLKYNSGLSKMIQTKQNEMDSTLQKLVHLCPNLEKLTISHCNVRTLPEINRLVKLKYFKLYDCGGVKEIPSITQLTLLKTLLLRNCYDLQIYPRIHNLRNLKNIDTVTSPRLKEDHRFKAFLSILAIDAARARKLFDSTCVDFKRNNNMSVSKILDLIDRNTDAEKEIIHYFLKEIEEKTRRYATNILTSIPATEVQEAILFLEKFDSIPNLKENAFKHMYKERYRKSLDDFKAMYAHKFNAYMPS